jgi:hypothetical protein
MNGLTLFLSAKNRLLDNVREKFKLFTQRCHTPVLVFVFVL